MSYLQNECECGSFSHRPSLAATARGCGHPTPQGRTEPRRFRLPPLGPPVSSAVPRATCHSGKAGRGPASRPLPEVSRAARRQSLPLPQADSERQREHSTLGPLTRPPSSAARLSPPAPRSAAVAPPSARACLSPVPHAALQPCLPADQGTWAFPGSSPPCISTVSLNPPDPAGRGARAQNSGCRWVGRGLEARVLSTVWGAATPLLPDLMQVSGLLSGSVSSS